MTAYIVTFLQAPVVSVFFPYGICVIPQYIYIVNIEQQLMCHLISGAPGFRNPT
jgi:hypothetical protein